MVAFGDLALQAATPLAGTALINGTQNIISWTTPNDGNNHRFMAIVSASVSSGQTGGQVIAQFTDPGGQNGTPQLLAGSQGAGDHNAVTAAVVGPNTTVTIHQNSALSVGATVLYAEIWGL